MPRLENLVAAVLDTHVWVWACAGDPRAAGLKQFKGSPLISAISVWEVAMLESKGRLRLRPDVEQWIAANLGAPVVLEPISPAISLRSCRLPEFHGDPADRLIVATAMETGIPLITADRQIIEWNERHRQLQLLPPA
ncbi:MAG: type II toxin-antitoxin system VapC family toxin [Oceanipulchritudo sp.]|jgi:PIN domain nuclease of toxin-antitoxin system